MTGHAHTSPTHARDTYCTFGKDEHTDGKEFGPLSQSKVSCFYFLGEIKLASKIKALV